MKEAEQMLETFINRKATHSTTSIVTELAEICQRAKFSSREAQEAFAQTCHNFGVYSREQGKTSWGKNQFIQWYNREIETAKVMAGYVEPSEDGYSIPDDKPPWEDGDPVFQVGSTEPVEFVHAGARKPGVYVEVKHNIEPVPVQPSVTAEDWKDRRIRKLEAEVTRLKGKLAEINRLSAHWD